jgi:uncharacterized DUF497 family protein
MSTRYVWAESKQLSNLIKHGLDFRSAHLVLNNPYRMEIESPRGKEKRKLVFAYVFDLLAVLTVVYLSDNKINTLRIISFRHANRIEKEKYFEWLENDIHDT